MSEKNIQKIQQLGDKGKVKKLLSYAGSKDEVERAAAAQALGASKEDDAFNALVSLLRDPSEQVQIAAVRSLGQSGRSVAVEHVRHLMNGGNPALAAACSEAIAMLQGQGDPS